MLDQAAIDTLRSAPVSSYRHLVPNGLRLPRVSSASPHFSSADNSFSDGFRDEARLPLMPLNSHCE